MIAAEIKTGNDQEVAKKETGPKDKGPHLQKSVEIADMEDHAEIVMTDEETIATDITDETLGKRVDTTVAGIDNETETEIEIEFVIEAQIASLKETREAQNMMTGILEITTRVDVDRHLTKIGIENTTGEEKGKMTQEGIKTAKDEDLCIYFL